MILDLEHIGNIPVSTSVIASLFTNIEAGNQKVRNLEAAHKIIRLKKGLYVVSPNVSRVALSTELVANHLYACDPYGKSFSRHVLILKASYWSIKTTRML